MKLFLVLSCAPRLDGEAIEVVSCEVVRHASRLGHDLLLQVILRDARASAVSVRAEEALQRLTIPRCKVLPTLYLEDVRRTFSRWRPLDLCCKAVLVLSESHLFPASRLQKVIEQRVVASQAEALLSVWSWEALAATYRISHVPKFVYYGNPDHLPVDARLRNPELFGIPIVSLWDRLRLLIERFLNWRRKRLHIKMMNHCEVVANNSILDAAFYKTHGHQRSIYLQNMWPEMERGSAVGCLAKNGSVKIIGNVGNLAATGNTFGLDYLGRRLFPLLESRFGQCPFEVHLLGKGPARESVSRYLTDRRIVFRGWVDNINSEIQTSDAFLVLTNANKDFLVGNTRILLAWALGACVVLHANSGQAMPEIQHGENVLMGRTPDEIADLIVRASEDRELRTKIGEGGFRTFQTYYRSDVVVQKMLTLVEDLVREFRQTGMSQPRSGDVARMSFSASNNGLVRREADSVAGAEGLL